MLTAVHSLIGCDTSWSPSGCRRAAVVVDPMAFHAIGVRKNARPNCKWGSQTSLLKRPGRGKGIGLLPLATLHDVSSSCRCGPRQPVSCWLIVLSHTIQYFPHIPAPRPKAPANCWQCARYARAWLSRLDALVRAQRAIWCAHFPVSLRRLTRE